MAYTVLCYLERDGQYLMLFRNRKKNDPNAGKWIGVGGRLEEGESPEDGLIREVREETGYRLTSYRLRGIVTFSSDVYEKEQMFLFTADGFTGEPIACDEGELSWIPIEKIPSLPLWEGDRIFLPLIRDKDTPFFFLKLCYRGDDLTSAVLNGKPLPLGTKED